jgi:hypothetical protein
VIERDQLPPDPDLDYCDSDLRLLAGLGEPVVVLSEDGVSRDMPVLVPSLFRRAALGPDEEAED